MLPDDEAPWSCNEKNCGFKTSSSAIRKILAVVQTEIDQLDALEPGPAAIEQREAMINKVFITSLEHQTMSAT